MSVKTLRGIFEAIPRGECLDRVSNFVADGALGRAIGADLVWTVHSEKCMMNIDLESTREETLFKSHREQH